MLEEGGGTPAPEGSGSISAAEGEKTLHVELTGLSPETSYYVGVVAQNTEGTTEKIPITFTTESSAPRAVGTTVLSTAETSAEVQGQLKPHLETQWCLEYATAESGPWTSFASGTISASDKLRTTSAASLTGLAAKMTYYVREFLINADGEATSPPTSFETVAPPVTSSPSIESESATSITEHDATLEAQIKPESGTELTYSVEYGATMSYGMEAPTPPATIRWFTCGLQCAGEDDIPRHVSINLTELEPGAIYHYRIVAANERGTTYGNDATFTTQPSPADPSGGEEKPPSSGGHETPSTGGSGGPSRTSSTSSGPPGGGLSPTPGVTLLTAPLVKMGVPKALTKAQRLAKALKLCGQKPKHKRAACEKRVKREYATTARDTDKKASEQNRAGYR